ncbi:hypothetical protein [Staphylococcus epidermidis]|uniref:hypothetical protein n=1 Tax=Staphylococcus epidermidis TaxID=1282 RepID=UPI0005FB0BC2|nr:hypothetical protein [Staphylococcus epidermidis]MDU2695940.1 hypothetical protein [Staphylococcus epidermidis]MEB7074503.1 hypothetical protein [Staphylococcus epidermidis]
MDNTLMLNNKVIKAGNVRKAISGIFITPHKKRYRENKKELYLMDNAQNIKSYKEKELNHNIKLNNSISHYDLENLLPNNNEFTPNEFKFFDKAVDKEWKDAKKIVSVSIDELGKIDNQSFEIGSLFNE